MYLFMHKIPLLEDIVPESASAVGPHLSLKHVLGLGAFEECSRYYADTLSDEALRRHQGLEVLVIAQAHRLCGTVLAKLDEVLRATRRTNAAFGGVRILLEIDPFAVRFRCRELCARVMSMLLLMLIPLAHVRGVGARGS